jgi:hypothetical protein
MGIGTLILSAEKLSVTIMTGGGESGLLTNSLVYSAQGSRALTYKVNSGPLVPVAVQATPAALDAGSLPLALVL